MKTAIFIELFFIKNGVSKVLLKNLKIYLFLLFIVTFQVKAINTNVQDDITDYSHPGTSIISDVNKETTQQQVKTITGKVTDSSGETLIGVSIMVKGTTRGTISDINGEYTLSNISDNATLVFSFLGMQPVEIPVGNQTNIHVQMEDMAIGIGEVLVIGYGTQSRELLTTSVSKVDTTAFANVPYSSPAHLLQGTTAGVRVTSTSGQPGKAPLIILRGGTALSPNDSYPLYVIDGVISPDMAGLNSYDIESIQVLKDAASTAIYGARGSNGVVLITTKGGKAGKTQITFNYDLSLSNYKTKMEMLDAEDFIYYNRLGISTAMRKWPFFENILSNASSAGTGNDLTNNTFYTTQYLTSENEHKLREGWSSMPDPLDPSKTIIFKGTDWRDVIYRTAVSHNYNVSASGGTEKATYSVSLGYLDNDGVAINTGYKRLSFNTKGDLKVSNNFTINSSVQYSKGNTKGVYDESGLFGRLLQVAPTVKYEFEDGTLAWGDGNKGNPEYKLSVIDQSSSSEKSTYTLGAKWDILPNLSFNPQASLFTMIDDKRSFTKANYEGVNYSDARPASQEVNRYYARQAEGYFNYNTSFLDSHYLNAMLGASFLETEDKRFKAAGRGAATDHIPTLNASAIPESVFSQDWKYRYMGYFTRITYDYKQKYIASVNARYDGASNLGANYRWGFFPGVSAGWNMHRENFMENISSVVLSKSKLRISYGVNGNTNALGPYLAQGSYGTGGRYAEMGALLNTVLPNPELKWEESKTFNIGADFEFFKKVNIIVDVYRRKTDNLVADRILSHETGFGSIKTNLGSLENKGFEIELAVQPLPASHELQWHFSANAAYIKNKILKLPYNGMKNNRIGGELMWDEKIKDYIWKGGLQEGGKMGDLYGYKQIGLYGSDEEAANAPRDMLVEGEDKDTKFGGDVIWFDSDGNNLIDQRDQVYMGNQYPKWTGGILNTLSYKGLSLIVRADFMLGHTIYNGIRTTTTAQMAGDLGLSEDAGKSWLKPGDEKHTNIPRLYYGDWQCNLARRNSIMFEKGDYLALREVTLSYIIPRKVLRRLPVNNLKLNFSGHNLHYFTKYKGINPENGGTDNGAFPISANYIFGVTLNF